MFFDTATKSVSVLSQRDCLSNKQDSEVVGNKSYRPFLHCADLTHTVSVLQSIHLNPYFLDQNSFLHHIIIECQLCTQST